jgi:hypothetical protein
MKLRALQNLGGVVQAYAGQEFEVTNEAQARDLIQQGVVVAVDSQGTEVQNLMHKSSEELVYQAEVNAMERDEYEKMRSEMVQKEVNKLEDVREADMQELKKMAQQRAEQSFTQQAQAQGQNMKQNEAQAQQGKQQAKGNPQLDTQSF